MKKGPDFHITCENQANQVLISKLSVGINEFKFAQIGLAGLFSVDLMVVNKPAEVAQKRVADRFVIVFAVVENAVAVAGNYRRNFYCKF